MSSWLVGSALLLTMLGSSWWAGWRVRRRLLPTWVGAHARLAESVVALALLVTVCQAVGAVGLFRRLIVVVVVVVASIAIGSAAGRRPSAPRGGSVPGGPVGPEGPLGALVAVGIVAGQWSTFTVRSLHDGIASPDSIWYSLPRAARFAATGWVTRLHFTAPEFPDTFHPANGELVQALQMLMFQRDVASATVNLGWLSLLLLAAWCVGSPFGQGSLSLAGAVVLLATPLFVVEGAGTADNDLAAIFFLLAAVAMALRAEEAPAALAIGGAAAGLAVSTKLTVVPAVVLLSGCVVWSVVRSGRGGRAIAWIASLGLFGSFWYVRNWVAVGTPVPATHLPLFPAPRFAIADTLGFSVSDYLTDGQVWRGWFLPGLRYDFGIAWPVVLLLLVAACVGALFGRRTGLVRGLGLALLGATGAYVVLPTTALGQRGAPVLFAANVIYLAPALMLAVTVLPTLRAPHDRRFSRALLLSFALVLALGTSTSGLSVWASEWTVVGSAVSASIVLLGAWVVWCRPTQRRRLLIGASAALVLVGTIAVAGHRGSERYANRPLYRWANDLRGARIAIAGFGGQFPFYGASLDNHVQYIGERGAHGEFHDVATCARWRELLRRDRPDYVVLRAERADTDDRQLIWTASDPAARLWFEDDGGSVFRFDPSTPDPGCR